MKSRYPVAVCFFCLLVIAGCASSPDMVRKRPSADVQLVPAKRADVAACIGLQLKAIEYFEVVESVESVQLKTGDTTIRLYDLEEAVGGTTVTLYTSSYIESAKKVIERCREYLGSRKPLPQRPAN
jgi:hypothetical protein